MKRKQQKLEPSSRLRAAKRSASVQASSNTKSKSISSKDDTESSNRPPWVPKSFVLAGVPHWVTHGDGISSSVSNDTGKGKTKQTDDTSKEQKKATTKEPTRRRDGSLIFTDYPNFRPNLTPKQVFQAGSFGGTYFRPITSKTCNQRFSKGVHLEFRPDWFEGLNISEMVTSATYRNQVNKYQVKSGNDLDFWESKGWMRPQDPYGWFQWYCRFYLGRRSDDDERQVSRWIKAIGPKGRWRTFLVGQCIKNGKAWDDPTASPVTRQTLLHWGYELTKMEYDRLAPPIQKGKSVVYLGKVA